MKLFLDIHDTLLLEGLREIIPQIATYCLVEDETEAELILTDWGREHEKSTYQIKADFPLNFEALLQDIQQKMVPHEVTFSHFIYNPRLRQLDNLHTHTMTALTEKESTLLLYFLKYKAQDVLREDLVKNVWGYHAGVDSHTIETHIYRLRQKIEDDPKLPKILLTTPGGYRLEA